MGREGVFLMPFSFQSACPHIVDQLLILLLNLSMHNPSLVADGDAVQFIVHQVMAAAEGLETLDAAERADLGAVEGRVFKALSVLIRYNAMQEFSF